VADFTPLGSCSRLDTLKLYGSYSAELQTISCSKVRVLQLSETDVSDLAHLSNLPLVTELDLSQTYVSDISPLACNAAALVSLDLSHTSIADVSVLALCGQLRRLNISFTSICDLQPLRVGG
jgi:Leucine-rich repeat (LRR) protein